MLWYPIGRTEEESWSSQVKFDCHAHVEHINQNSGKSLQPKLCESDKHADSDVLTEQIHLQHYYKSTSRI